jgi:hypothetical protein
MRCAKCGAAFDWNPSADSDGPPRWSPCCGAQWVFDVSNAEYEAWDQNSKLACTPSVEHELSLDCWCSPEVDYVDPESGAAVVVHKAKQ